jgi:hypothetical protein
MAQRDLGRVTAHGFAMLRQQLNQRPVDVGDQTVSDRNPDQNRETTLLVTENTCPLSSSVKPYR